jgi:hypothetical protein
VDLSATERRPQILHEQEQVERVCRRSFEPEVLVERARIVVLGMDQNRTSTDLTSGGCGPTERILKERRTKARSLLPPAHV